MVIFKITGIYLIMQTFLPSPDFRESAKALDNKRLNKQIVEAFQILSGRVPTNNHPACLMWDGYDACLRCYIDVMANEYRDRFSRTHSIQERIRSLDFYSDEPYSVPIWIGDKLFHLAHRVNLLRKDFIYYHTNELFYGIGEESLLNYPKGYYWPVAKPNGSAFKDRASWIAWKSKNNF